MNDPVERPEYSLPPSQMSVRLPRVLNKLPSEVQITAEQLLREALANQTDDVRPPRVQINDLEELDDYMQRKRAEFENTVRKQRHHVNAWVKYATFEEDLGEIKRARNIFLRALEVDYTNHTLWIKFAEMEMRNKMVGQARNVWEKAIYLLPKVDQLWYKYAFMEEMLCNYKGARKIYMRWMEISPPIHSWVLYSRFEERMGEKKRSKEIIYEMIDAHPEPQTYIKVARYEEKRKNSKAARSVFEKCLEELGPHANTQEFLLAFCEFEIRQKEIDRARVLFKHGINKLSREKAPILYQKYVDFEKQFGSKLNIEIVVLNKRRALYEKELAKDPMNYDTWFDYIYLEEAEGNVDRIRETYERAVSNLPSSEDKKYWRRYIYFWINFAVFEELKGETERARLIYEKAIKIIPHKQFSFAKVWVFYAHFEVRQLNLDKARKILGAGIGNSGSDKIFEAYIELELHIGNIDRCRTLHKKWIERDPFNAKPWVKFAELEFTLGEIERARYILENAIIVDGINTPEILWKAFIDIENDIEEYENVEKLYERLLNKTSHLKVWVSYAKFFGQISEIDKMRNVFERADRYFKEIDDRENRYLALKEWLDLEEQCGNDNKFVQDKMPKVVKKQRKFVNAEEEEGWEEYLDYIFPDDQSQALTLKILAKAESWKQKANEE